MENIFTASQYFLVYAKLLGLFSMATVEGKLRKEKLKWTMFNAIFPLIAISKLT